MATKLNPIQHETLDYIATNPGIHSDRLACTRTTLKALVKRELIHQIIGGGYVITEAGVQSLDIPRNWGYYNTLVAAARVAYEAEAKTFLWHNVKQIQHIIYKWYDPGIYELVSTPVGYFPHRVEYFADVLDAAIELARAEIRASSFQVAVS